MIHKSICEQTATSFGEQDYKGMYEKSMQRLATLSRISESIALGNNTNDTWRKVLKEIVGLMGANIGSIYMLNETRDRLYCMVEYCDIPDVQTAISDGIDVSLLEGMPIMDVLIKGQSVKLDNISSELDSKLNLYISDRPYNYKSSICSPILIGSSIDGAIAVSSKKQNCFNEDDLKVLNSIGYIIGTTLYNDRLLAMLRDSREALAKAFSAVSNARMAERTKLSRELHDDIGQRLTSLSLSLKALQHERDIDVITDRLNNLRLIVNNTHEELKRILLDLRPSGLKNNHLFSSIKKIVQDVSSDSGIDIQVKVPEGSIDIPSNIELVLYRCVQEGVANIVRHSHATHASIALSLSSNNVLLEIKDNGIGLPVNAYLKGTGLVGMKSRVVENGGVFSADSSKQGGTNISIVLPIKP